MNPSPRSTQPPPALRTRPHPACAVCGSDGAVRHERLHDHWFGTPGTWSMRECNAPGCGSLWLDPAPHPDDLWLAYRGYYTHSTSRARRGALRSLYDIGRRHYLARRFDYPRGPGGMAGRVMGALLGLIPGRREMLDASVMFLESTPGGAVLDVGCGDGARVRILQELGWRASGIDPDADAIAPGRLEGLDIRVGTLESRLFDAATFDAVTLHHVIEHVPDPRASLLESARLLRPGGSLVIVTPNAKSLGHATFGPAWRGLEPPRHLQIYTRAGLERAVAEAGFGKVECRTMARIAPILFVESAPFVGPGDRIPRGPLAALRFEARERRALVRDADAGEEIVCRATR